MTARSREPVRILLLLAAFMAGVAPLHAQSNYWTNTYAFGGFWEDPANWSIGAPDAAESVFITNIPVSANVFIGPSTSGNHPETMTVSNLTIAESFLNFSGAGTNVPLHILNELDIEGTGLYQTNSILQVDGPMILNGYYALLAGAASVSNLAVGNNPFGQIQLNGGVLRIFPGILTVGTATTNSNGHVDLEGGTLIHTNGIIMIGGSGVGSFGLGSGTVLTLGAQLSGQLASLGIGGQTNGSFYASKYVLVGNNVDAIGSAFVQISTNGLLCVTNATQSAYIDLGASGSLTLYGGVLKVDNLILTNGGIFTNISGTVICPKPYQVENNSTVSINGGSITTETNFTLGALSGSTGTLIVADGGTLNITNASLGIGNDGTTNNGAGIGNGTVSNAILNASTINLGSTAGGIGNLNLQNNANVNVTSNFTMVSGSMVATSTVSVAAGALLSVPNGTISIGSSGSALMDISGTVMSHNFQVGGQAGSASGSAHVMPGGILRSPRISANLIVVDGGDLDGSGGTVIIGENHDAELDFNSGNGLAGTMYVGYTPGFTGTFKQSGGIVVVSTNMIVGDCVNGALGVPIVSGGTLYVTNAAHTAVLDVRNGTFVLNAGGTLVVDNLILTNACGHFLKAGGALIMNHPPTLDPNLDADGDGQSNGAEALAGTDPLDPTSRFQMISATVTNKDVWVSWTTVGGHSYVVQTNGNLGVGVFHDLSPVIAVPGSSAGVTNYQHKNGATNRAEIYRVRLGP